jgi:hypothetical protein
MHLKEVLKLLRAELAEEGRAIERQRLRAWVLREAQRYADAQAIERLIAGGGAGPTVQRPDRNLP